MTNLPFDKKDVFSALNYEEASKYIGALGYFSDSLKGLINEIINNKPYRLDAISDISPSFILKESDSLTGCSALFIPEEKVHKEEKEKKLRPFNLLDICETFTLGDQIHFRRKDKNNQITARGYWLFTGFIRSHDPVEQDIPVIYFGGTGYTPKQLFENYEYQDENGNWRPFGIEIEE